MQNSPQLPGAVESDTHRLYRHLLELKRVDGEPATDAALLHREVARSPECVATRLDAAALAGYCLDEGTLPESRLGGLRDVLDREHRHAFDSRFSWKPRWLNSPQAARHAHPTIASHALHHRPRESQH